MNLWGKNYGTMDKIMVLNQNYGTISRTRNFGLRMKKTKVDYKKVRNFDL